MKPGHPAGGTADRDDRPGAPAGTAPAGGAAAGAAPDVPEVVAACDAPAAVAGSGTPHPPLATVLAREYGWSGPIRLPQLWEPLCDAADRVTFGMLVSARECAWDPALQTEALAVGRLLRARFEHQHGVIQNSYFCRYTRGGCAVTEQAEGSGRHRRVVRRLHSVLNSPAAPLVAMETGCGVLADDAAAVFAQRPETAGQLRAATDRIFSVMTRVLGAADVWARGGSTAEERAAVVDAAQVEYAAASRTVNVSIQRQARFVYFQGVLLGAVLAIACCAAIGALDAARWSRVIGPGGLVAATVFGALGALASVFQRMSTGRLVLDFTASRGQLVTLGGVRPFVGALFGAVVHFILVASVLGAAPGGRTGATVFATFAITGFAAGFSERFATDMIERAGSVIAGTATSTTAASGTSERSGRQRTPRPPETTTGTHPTPTPGQTSVPAPASIPGQAGVPGQASGAGLVRVPGQASVPGPVSASGPTSVSGQASGAGSTASSVGSGPETASTAGASPAASSAGSGPDATPPVGAITTASSTTAVTDTP